jgi:hypothetical protein
MFHYSPLNIFQFRRHPTENDKLHAFVYDEGDGKSRFDGKEEDGKLNFIIDNCWAKQRIAWSCDCNSINRMGSPKKVNFLFFGTRSHKNPCDRMFNILQAPMQETECLHHGALLQVLNKQDQVTFFDLWIPHLDKFS